MKLVWEAFLPVAAALLTILVMLSASELFEK